MNHIEAEFKIVEKEFKSYESQISADIQEMKFTNTFNCILHKCYEVDKIREAIEMCGNNFYSSQILLRTLLEHYLVGYYVFIKCLTNEDDLVGEEYYKNYFISEFFKRETYHIQIENIKKNSSEKINFETLKKAYPEFNSMEQKDLDDIHRTAKQFSDMKSIGNYLINKTNKILLPIQNLNVSLLDFLERYIELSSYIHGGPSAEMFTYNNQNFQKQKDLIIENIDWGKSVSSSLKTFLLLLLARENPKYFEPLKVILNQ